MSNNDWINKVIEDTIIEKKFKRRIQIGIDHLDGKNCINTTPLLPNILFRTLKTRRYIYKIPFYSTILLTAISDCQSIK